MYYLKEFEEAIKYLRYRNVTELAILLVGWKKEFTSIHLVELQFLIFF